MDPLQSHIGRQAPENARLECRFYKTQQEVRTLEYFLIVMTG